MESFLKLQQLRRDLEQAKELLQAVRQREVFKREVLNVVQDMFEQERYDLVNTTGIPRQPVMLKRRPGLRDKLYLKQQAPIIPRQPVPVPAEVPPPQHVPYDDAEKVARQRARQQKANRQRQRQRQQQLRAQQAAAQGHRPSWWRAPDVYLGLPNASRADTQDPLELGIAMGLPLGLPAAEAAMYNAFPERAVSHSGLRPKMALSVARNARATMGRLGFFGSRGWEADASLATGIGGAGPFGEGWDTLGTRPEQQPPPVGAVAPDLDVISYIRSRRADKHQEQQLMRVAHQYQRNAQQLVAAVTAGKTTQEKANEAIVQANEAMVQARAAVAKNARASAAMRAAPVLGPLTPGQAGAGPEAGAGSGAGAGAGAGTGAGAGAVKQEKTAPGDAAVAPKTPTTPGPAAGKDPRSGLAMPPAVCTPGGAGQWGAAATPMTQTPLGIGTTPGALRLRSAHATSSTALRDTDLDMAADADADADSCSGSDSDGGDAVYPADVGPRKRGKHIPGYFCRPRLGRGGRLIIDRLPVTVDDAPRHAAAWLALAERNRSKQRFRGTGRDMTSNRWAWRHTAAPTSSSGHTSLLDPAAFERVQPFGPPSDLRPVASASFPALPPPASRDARIPAPVMPALGDDVMQHYLQSMGATDWVGAALTGAAPFSTAAVVKPDAADVPAVVDASAAGVDGTTPAVAGADATAAAAAAATAAATAADRAAATATAADRAAAVPSAGDAPGAATPAVQSALEAARPGGPGAGPVAGSPAVFGFSTAAACEAVRDGGAGARLLATARHPSWTHSTHDGLPPVDSVKGLPYLEKITAIYKEKKSGDRAGAEDKDEAAAVAARELLSTVPTWLQTDVDSLYSPFL